MHHSFTILALTLAGLRSGVFAYPLPQYSFPDSNAQCAANANPGPEYENTSERQTTGEPIQIGASCTPNGDNECQLGRENSYTVGVTTTVGADLGLSYADVFSAGINAEVSYSGEEDTTDTNQQICSGPCMQHDPHSRRPRSRRQCMALGRLS